MLNWLKKRRLTNLREQLAVVNAEIEKYKDISRRSGYIYPIAETINAKEQARLMFRIAELEKSL